MSYDLQFIRVAAGEDAVAVAEAALEAEEAGINPGPADAGCELRKRAIAEALLRTNPSLRIFQFDFAEVARLQGTTVAEARRAFRHLELDAGEGSNGIQITLYDETASLTVPYWHRDAAARDLWSDIWRYVDVLSREGSFVAYDPQLERRLDPDSDGNAVLESYAGGATFTDGVSKDIVQGSSERRWWKFWSPHIKDR